ncbi:MAG: MmgE/PrpD family protein [Burkholderiales bacterium]|nr:MmgE/PrpD family protein [Burkholderiales bacterium]
MSTSMATSLQSPRTAPDADHATAQLARFVAGSRGASLPASVERAACRGFANWLGCALGAADDEAVRAVLAVARVLSGREQASLVGRADRLDAVNAALVNGVAANALDYDDMHTPTLIHPTGPVVAAALALAESRGAGGKVLLCAVVAGIEVECRLGLALFPRHYDRGFHITATLGTLGAAAASCVVLGLDAARTQHALGIAATQAGGLRAMLTNACKSFNIGKAASAGALAALLAEAGLDSEPAVIEARFGLLDAFGPAQGAEVLTRDLGVRYLLPEVSLKPYPCGVVIHPLIDACLAAATRGDSLRPAQVRAIRAWVHPRALELAGRAHPVDAIAGRYSLQHAAALALTSRAAGLAAFDGADVNDPELVRLRESMSIEPDPALAPAQARVALELDDGEVRREAVDHPCGSPERPLDDAQLRAKFMELAVRAIEQPVAEELFELGMGLAQVADIRELARRWSAPRP